MEILANSKFQLIKRDIRALKKHIIYNNNIKDWSKIIIIYNAYLLFNHFNALFNLMSNLINESSSFNNQYKKIFLFFFLMCNLKNSYVYFIININKIDPYLANNIYNNTKEYFI